MLDVGCGIGQRLVSFKNGGFNVYGVDPSRHRSAIALEALQNIESGTGEEYLRKVETSFDAIFFFNVLQFVQDPFQLLEQATTKLKAGGVLFFSVGQFYNDSNYCQFAHLGLLRSFLTLYCMKNCFKQLDLWPLKYSPEPFEIILRKGSASEDSDKILNSASKLTVRELENYAKKTLNIFSMRLIGKTKVKYQGRSVALRRENESNGIIPVNFCYESPAQPVLLK